MMHGIVFWELNFCEKLYFRELNIMAAFFLRDKRSSLSTVAPHSWLDEGVSSVRGIFYPQRDDLTT